MSLVSWYEGLDVCIFVSWPDVYKVTMAKFTTQEIQDLTAAKDQRMSGEERANLYLKM